MYEVVMAHLSNFRLTPQIWAYIQVFLMVFVGLIHQVGSWRNAALKYCPSSITAITVINMATNTTKEIYSHDTKKWAVNFADNMCEHESAYYLFNVWDQNACLYKEYCLSAEHVKKSLQITHLECMMYLMPSYIVHRLAKYHEPMEPLVKQRKLFEMTYEGRSIIASFKRLEASLYMDDNLTAQAIAVLSAFFQKAPLKTKSDEQSICITDFDFEEKSVAWDSFLFPSKQDGGDRGGSDGENADADADANEDAITEASVTSVAQEEKIEDIREE